ncbi:MAG TPA: DUF3443 family protein, partial [Vicinamibacterales bacterium]|nr:DUF3443 family protein [Vicinamibacterales bacterium]
MPRLFLLALLIAQVTPQCGGSTSSGGGSTITPSPSTTINNTLAVTVSAGPNNDYINGLFTSVQVCVPGSSSCQTIGNVLVDTGSVGLRLVSSVVNLSLPQQTTSGGAPIVECAQFQDGFTWGPLRTADVLLGTKKASNVPIQVIGESAFANSIPQQCSSTGAAENTVADLGANGILGVGQYNEDCGGSCERVTNSNPGFYYACPSSGCTLTTVSSAVQARNPVSLFSSDSNGIVIQLPSIPAGGTTSVNGTMYFGISTQS